ncbi:MAG: hypothetical protein K8F60_04195 [Melioribacteraceae bacterium]|nr:hypothetical protein [Melioribacteraceae bacterium]
MKKLILFIMMVSIYSAQTINFGVNGSIKFSKFNRVGIGEFEQWRNNEMQITIYSLNCDWEYVFNKNIAALAEIGYTFSTQNDFQGPEIGLYFSSNQLFKFAYMKAGLLFIWNVPFNTPHNPVMARMFTLASLSIVKPIYDNIALEVFYQIPLKSKYVDEKFVTTEFINNLLGFGLRVDI